VKKKLKIQILTLICMLAISFILVAENSDGREPPNLTLNRLSGPVIVGTLVIQENCDGSTASLTMVAKCKKGDCAPIVVRVDPFEDGVPQSEGDVEDFSLDENDMNALLPDSDGDGLADCRDPDPGDAQNPGEGNILSHFAAAFVSNVVSYQSWDLIGDDGVDDLVIAEIEMTYFVPIPQ